MLTKSLGDRIIIYMTCVSLSLVHWIGSDCQKSLIHDSIDVRYVCIPELPMESFIMMFSVDE